MHYLCDGGISVTLVKSSSSSIGLDKPRRGNSTLQVSRSVSVISESSVSVVLLRSCGSSRTLYVLVVISLLLLFLVKIEITQMIFDNSLGRCTFFINRVDASKYFRFSFCKESADYQLFHQILAVQDILQCTCCICLLIYCMLVLNVKVNAYWDRDINSQSLAFNCRL